MAASFFTVTFMKRVKPNSAVDDRLNDRLNSREKKLLQILAETPGLRTNELSSMMEVSIPTLSRTLKNLIDLGLIEYRGAKKTGGYFIVYVFSVHYFLLSLGNSIVDTHGLDNYEYYRLRLLHYLRHIWPVVPFCAQEIVRFDRKRS